MLLNIFMTPSFKALGLRKVVASSISLGGGAGHGHATSDLSRGGHVQLVEVARQCSALGNGSQQTLDGIKLPLPAVVVLFMTLGVQGQLRQHV